MESAERRLLEPRMMLVVVLIATDNCSDDGPTDILPDQLS
jgi:hypothetical protein